MPISYFVQAIGKRLRLKRREEILRECEGLSAVESLAVSISCDAFARHFCPRVCCPFRIDTFLASCAGPKASSRTHHYCSANLLIARGHCFTALTFSFAMRVSEPVTPIFVPPVKIPAPCHVRLGGPTLKPCESFAVCRTRLFLSYVPPKYFICSGNLTKARHMPKCRMTDSTRANGIESC